MSPWMLALASSSPSLVTQTFTASTTWPVPAGVTALVAASGFGARGTDAGTTTTYYWTRFRRRYFYGRDGQTTFQIQGDTVSGTGHAPSDYCDPIVDTPSDPSYFSYQDCYSYQEYSQTTSYPATTGSAATAFGKTFPGSTGNVAPAVTTFQNIAVTTGQSYSIVVPSGGSITISYYQ